MTIIGGTQAPITVAHLLASDITTSAKGKTPEAEDLAAAISEITLRTQIAGASTLTIDLIDPDGVISSIGFLDANDDGMLDAIEVEYPPGTGSFWRLSSIDGTSELNGANLTLTFEDRIVAYLRDHWGPKTVAPGTTTFMQFVKSLVDEVGRSGDVPKIRFVCPSIDVVQPVEKDDKSDTTVVQTPTGKTAAHAKTNKKRAVHPDAAISIAGQTPTAEQIHNINIILGVAELQKAGHIACLALLYAAIGETQIGKNPGTYKPNSAGYWGVFQGSTKTWPDPHDVAGQAAAFLKGGQGFQAGGAMALSRTVPDPIEIAVRVEAPSIWPDNAYARQAGSGNFVAEAKAILESYGGAALGSQGSTGVPVSDIGQLQRGTSDDPDEDSWDCGCRLAQQRNWSLFSNGNYLYLMDGPDLIAQRPALYLDCVKDKASILHLSYTVDNTTYLRAAGDKVKRRPLSKAATPSEVRLDLVCDEDAYRAGDVIVLRNKGPVNGRWIISDATRRCLGDTFTSFTLAPPTQPTAEPKFDQGAGDGTSVSPAAGVSSVAEAAKKALGEKAKYVYREVRPMPGTLFGPAPRIMDCSGFATLCYKAAGLKDPNGSAFNYNGAGNTTSLIANSTKTDTPNAGDLCFYGGNATNPAHVTVYVGEGQCISMGHAGDPHQGPAESTGPKPFLGYYTPRT